MKNLLLFALLGLACGAAAVAQSVQNPPSEQNPQVLETVTIPASAPLSIEVPARRLPAYAIDFGAYKGAYDLSNGGLLQLSSQGRRMYAQLDDGERTEIVGTGKHSFVALDRSVQMRFEPKSSGEMGGELLLARQPAIAGQPVQYLLVSLR
ncbi:hypothetical protein ASD15_18735 [Massilia sp. Root351]|jgi:opacity protein-like surface antigen|uniref:hypothetical protein n=1 Tax=Massilia sp. Root351 TaxID=1736522 RepID=UPI00070D3447|nr:hypothetical protein [Massilia sp. Root351]KQV79370.1 hypothetical protein ASD15_18735 [Massilia sp. Root351]